eukprot:scaffold2215_cov353-Prasinococcus_capsulatus_cf.AAC.8
MAQLSHVRRHLGVPIPPVQAASLVACRDLSPCLPTPQRSGERPPERYVSRRGAPASRRPLM